jgi:bacterioferritin (cytochrome b1)
MEAADSAVSVDDAGRCAAARAARDACGPAGTGPRNVQSARNAIVEFAPGRSWPARSACILRVSAVPLRSMPSRPTREDEMPKKEPAPKKGAMKSKAAAAKKPARARKPAPALEDDLPDDLPEEMDPVLEVEEMDEMEDEAPARKSAAPRAPKAKAKAGKGNLVELLNQSLGWELRAQAMYAHYAAYVKGVESLTLAEHFEGEVTESLGHEKKVRDIIAALGGEAVTTRDDTEIVHTEDTQTMLEEALKTESAAAAAYKKIIPQVKDNAVFYHAIYHILKDETAAVIEVETLLGR